MRRVSIESRRRVFDDFFKIEEARVCYERFDGRMSEPVRRLNVERGDSVAAVILNRESRQVVLVEQFRYPTYEKGPEWTAELVAGIVEGDELPERSMKREILEEVGFRVPRLTPISTFYLSPGGSSERVLLYYAEISNDDRVGQGGGVAAEHEDIQLVDYPLQAIAEALQAGTFVDAKTIIGLTWLVNKSLAG